MVPPPHSYARLDEHRASHRAGAAISVSAQSWSDQCWVDVRLACPMGRCQQDCGRVAEFEHLPCGACWWMGRSRYPPSS